MSVYIYCNRANTEHNAEITNELIRGYMVQRELIADHIHVEQEDTKVCWSKRKIGRLLQEELKAGDVLVVYGVTDVACSACQMLEILMAAISAGVHIHFAKYNQVFTAQEYNQLKDMLRLMQHIDRDFMAYRTTDTVARHRAAGLPLGRPKGRKNKSLKLDKHRGDIKKYLELGVSKASIAKIVDCHPQTLYDWLDRNSNEQAAS